MDLSRVKLYLCPQDVTGHQLKIALMVIGMEPWVSNSNELSTLLWSNRFQKQ